jgi:hypothetical protein
MENEEWRENVQCSMFNFQFSILNGEMSDGGYA